MSGLPLLSECNLDDPEEHLLWSYADLQMGMASGNPLVTKPDVLKKWSKQQYQAGIRFVPECQEMEFVAPPGGVRAFGPPGLWVPIEKAAEMKAANREAQAREFADLQRQLREAMPEFAEKVDAMSDGEKANARKETMAALQEQMQQMKAMYDRLKKEEEG